ncbi:hypothetical protein A9Q99_12040 [Gammaproteobacteria bacterium 45_16_T64]|nr:hypothetical protein A9Q99_12040 [Gammaproteobacteria bacterium 45_16_T64]
MLLSKSQVFRRVIAPSLVGIAGCAVLTSAQAEGGDSVSVDGARDLVDVVTVTAQKREEEIQDVPISMTALNNSDLERFSIDEPADVSLYSPGVYSRPTIAHNNPLFTVRGVGFNDFTSIQNPAVAVYVDNVTIPYHTMMGFQLYDMERVEVLKGPQGTLYGRNSTAGAINFITHKPVYEFEAYGIADYSSYDTYQLEGMVNIPILDTLTSRVAIKSNRRFGSFYDNRAQDDSHYGEENQLDGRISVLWEPTENIELLVNIHGGYNRSGLVAPDHLATYDLGTMSEPCGPVANGVRDEGACQNLAGYSDSDNDPYGGEYSVDDKLDNEASGGFVELNWYFYGLTFTGLTGYESFKRYQPQDADASPYKHIDMLFEDETTSFSQELRLSSVEQQGYHWMVGLYYSEDSVDAFQSADVSDFAALVGLPGNTASVPNEQESDSIAAFVNADTMLNPVFNLYGGLRYTVEHKEWEGGSTLGVVENLYSNDITHRDLSGNVGLQWLPKEGIMWYVSATKSYRSGGFAGAFSLPVELEPFDEEEVYAYEIGMKSLVLEDQLTVNSAVYYYDWRELQTVISEVVGGLVSLPIINVGDAKIYGVELDMAWRSSGPWELSGGFNWMKTEVVDANEPELEGNALANAPELMFNGVALYHCQVGDYPITLQMDAHYTDTYFFSVENDAIFENTDLWLYNARVTVTVPQQASNVEFAVWGKNLSDEDYQVGGFKQFGFSGDSFHYYGEPRTVGVALKVSL